MVHNSLEEHLHSVCPNCGQEHDAKFFSHFTEDKHYIVGDCAHCGYRVEFRRDDLGSGLFMPDGTVTTISDVFKSKHTEHVKEALEARSIALPHSLSGIGGRVIDPRREAKKEEKK